MLYLITNVFVDLFFSIIIIFHSIPLLFFVLFSKQNKHALSIIIFSYCLYSLTIDIVRSFEHSSTFISNLPFADFFLLSTYTIVEYILLASCIYILLRRKTLKRLILILSIIFLIVAITNLIQSLRVKSSDLDSIPIAVSSLILITGSILYFFESIQNPEIGFIYSKPGFWVVVGIMIYFSGTFFLFLQYDNLSKQEKDSFWIINIICFILKNIFFSISFILKPENQQISNVDDYYLNKLE